MIVIHNDGQLITDTNYWMTEQAQGGKVYCSLNAGAVRLLLPRMRFPEVADMEMAKECVISLGPWPEHYGRDAVEILFDDLSQNPYALFLVAESFDFLPAEPPPGREWILSVWVEYDGRPYNAFERVCHWRRVPCIPWLKAWGK